MRTQCSAKALFKIISKILIIPVILFLFSTCIINDTKDFVLDVSVLRDHDESNTGTHIESYEQYLKDEVVLDPILFLYEDLTTKKEVVDFYTKLTGQKDIALAILNASTAYNIPPSLAFALAYRESGFNPKDVSFNATSRDRGLFQLNNLSFPKLTDEHCFNPVVNAQYGLEYLSQCLKVTGNEIAALAMYNAGRTRVETGGTPRKTLDYISDIQKIKQEYFRKFSIEVTSLHIPLLMNRK